MRQILERQYLTFTIADERYALAVGRVREVLELTRITKLPGQLRYFKGLIDLRGKGIPVIDMRARFGIPGTEATENRAIIVAELGTGTEMKLVGLLADAVHEVFEVDPGIIEAPPGLNANRSELLLKGIAKDENGFVILLDADRLLDTEELDEAEKAMAHDGEPVVA